MISFFKKNLKVFLLILFTSTFFWNLTQTFYQQDEWHGLGDILVYGPASVFQGLDIWQILLGEGRVFADLLVYFFLGKFPFSIAPVAVFALIFHSLNTTLVYVVLRKFLKSETFSFIGSLFFSINAVSSGSIIWVASGTGTLPATTCILLSVLTFFEYLKEKKIKWYWATFILIYISLWFKEIGIFLFAFYPLYYFYVNPESIKKYILKFLPFFTVGLMSIGYRILALQSIATQQDLFLTGSTNNYYFTLLLRFVLYPLTSFSLIFAPSRPTFEVAKRITWSYYSFFPNSLHDLIAQTAVIDMLALAITLLVLFILYELLRGQSIKSKQEVMFFIGISLASFLPYIIVAKSYAYLESRYYYVAAIAAAFILALLLQRTFSLRNKLWFSVCCLMTLGLFFVHAKQTSRDISFQVDLKNERMNILQEMIARKPELYDSHVFYITGDRNYYVSDGNPTPMQQGMGYTLLVWYYAQGRAPIQDKLLIRDFSFWGIQDQGYVATENGGYGYYTDKTILKKDLAENKFGLDDIFAFYYDSSTKKIQEITGDIVSELK